MRWHAWAIAAGAATTLLFACVGTSPTLPMSQCDGTDTFCGGACTNTQGDARNCGGCGKTCNTQAGEVCQKGACGPACSGGTTRCGMGCLDVENDPQNCGDCNKKCASAESCVTGKCTLVCQTGLTSCPRAGSVADGGMAEAGSAEAGTPSTSGCTDMMSDPLNCGKCGAVCSGDKARCDKGACKIFKFQGILTNVSQDDLSSDWGECFSETYNITTTTIPSILTNKCTGGFLMLACRQTGQKTLVVAADAPRVDVVFDTNLPPPYGSYAYAGTSHISNGTAWYFSPGCCNGTPSGAWGFAEIGDTLNRVPYDTAMGLAPEKRLSWAIANTGTGTLTGGYRCGATVSLQMSAQYERVIFQAQ